MSVMEKKQVERVFHLYSKAKQCAVNKGWGHKLDEGKKTDFWIAAHWFASGSLLSDGGRAPMGGKKKNPAFDHLMSHPWKPSKGTVFQDMAFPAPCMLESVALILSCKVFW